jgi:hypothetical protein
MRERRGFDLVVGNPPWMKPLWVDADILSAQWPELAIRGATAASVDTEKKRFLKLTADKVAYLNDYVAMGGFQSFLSRESNFPFSGGGQTNLYRAFIDVSFRLASAKGFAALVHQDSHLTDPNGGSFRRHWYRRIRSHFNFHNVMKSKLFAEVNHQTYFSLNIYGAEKQDVRFEHASRLYLPHMIDDCYQHDGVGPVPSPKNQAGQYVAAPHRMRVVSIDSEVLKTFCGVIEDESCPFDQTRFLFPYSQKTIGVLSAIAKVRGTLDAA